MTEAQQTVIQPSTELTPVSMFLDLFPMMVGLSLIFGLAYGAAFLLRPASIPRTGVKVLGVLLIAVICLIDGSPAALIAGLMFSAVGDGFLAGDGKRWLPYGLGAFLVAHLAYIVLFVSAGHQAGAFDVHPWRIGLIAVAVISGGAMLRWLWVDLGALRWAVSAYVAAIVGMVGFSLTLPIHLWPAMLGASMFMASDTLLSVQLFKPRAAWSQSRVAGLAVWFLYFLGQWGIAAAFLRS